MRNVYPFSIHNFAAETLIPFLTLSFPTSLKYTRYFNRSHSLHSKRISFGCRFLGEIKAGGCGEEEPPFDFQFNALPISGAKEALLDFINGKRKATDLVHLIWKNVIHGGDTVIDATCGNGYDTLALLRMIADDSRRGCVYGLDIQNSALRNTADLLKKNAAYLLKQSDADKQRDLVKLSLLCHSRMDAVITNDTPVRLIAFNLGYLPGGDKAITTKPYTTILALQAACRILAPGGLVTIVAYVAHPGGREELDAILTFASSLPVKNWNTFKFEIINRRSGPVLILMFKKYFPV